MPNLSPIAVIEAGTTKTTCLIAMPNPDGSFTPTGFGSDRTTGMRKGEITQRKYVSTAIKCAVRRAADQSGTLIGEINLVCSGGETASVCGIGRHNLSDRNRVVTEAALEAVQANLDATFTHSENRFLLHTASSRYTLDDRRTVIEPPLGESARTLQLESLIIHTYGNFIDTLRETATDAQLVVNKCLFAGVCADEAVLTDDQRKAGVLLLHLGGGTTCYLLYRNGMLVAAGSFGIGGDHITNDIQQAFHVTEQQSAEQMKIKYGCALVDLGANASETFPIPSSSHIATQERRFPVHSLHKVINARCVETLTIIRDAFREVGLLGSLGAGVVLTGGGAYLNGLPELTTKLFNMPCSIGTPKLGDFYGFCTQPSELAALTGAMSILAREAAESAAAAAASRRRRIFPWSRQ